MKKIDALLKTMEVMAQASRGGYRCNTEIDELYDAILKEIAKLDDSGVESIEGVAHLLANKWMPITESDASALLKGVLAGDPQLKRVYERYGSTSADWSCFEPLSHSSLADDLRGVELAEALYKRVQGDNNAMIALRARLNYVLGGTGE